MSLSAVMLVWSLLAQSEAVPGYMLPAPSQVLRAFAEDFPLLLQHSAVTLREAVYGLLAGTAIAIPSAVLMDRFRFLRKAVYPVLVLSQTVPTVAIAPLLVLWMGFSMAPKITLVILTTFFPVTVSLLDGLQSTDRDQVNLLRSMGATHAQIFFHVRLPHATEAFFSGLKVSATYAVVGAVIAEWLGGFEGLGVYMTRVRKAYAFDRMFAVILLTSVVSLLLMAAVRLLEKAAMPYKRTTKNKKRKGKCNMKKITAVITVLSLLLCFAACADNASRTELTTVTLCLDWTPNTNHTGFFVADQMDYYKEAGLAIQIVQPPEDGAEMMTAAGQAQFGVSFQDTLAAALASDEPLGVTAVAALLQHNTSGIISRKGEGMHTPAGLADKRYSTWNNPVELKMMEYIMEKDGADFSQLQCIPSSVTNEAQALRNNETDAIWIYYAWAGIACELDGLEFDYFNFTDIDPVFDYYTPVLIANNQFLADEPETAKAFLAATAKGYRYAAEHPQQAAQMLITGDTTGSLNSAEELVTKSQEWIAAQYIADAPYWGYIDGGRWNAFYGWLLDNALIEKDIRDTAFSNDWLTEE